MHTVTLKDPVYYGSKTMAYKKMPNDDWPHGFRKANSQTNMSAILIPSRISQTNSFDFTRKKFQRRVRGRDFILLKFNLLVG